MWIRVLLLLLYTPLVYAKCISVQDAAFQDQFFYDIYSTVIPSDYASQFYSIIHNSSKTKAEILTSLNELCDQVGGIMLDAEKNSLQHQTERMNTANNLIQSSTMSEQAKNFAQQNADNIYNMGQTWPQTCQANNRLLEEQPQSVLDEVNANTDVRSQIQMFINAQCMSTLEKLIAQRRYQFCGNNNQGGNNIESTSGYNGWLSGESNQNGWDSNNNQNVGGYDYDGWNTGNGQNSQYYPYNGNQNGQYNPNSGNPNGDFYSNNYNQNGNYQNGKRHKGHHHRGHRHGRQGQYSNNGDYGYESSNNGNRERSASNGQYGGYFNGHTNEYPLNQHNNGFEASFYPQFVDGAKNKAPSNPASAQKSIEKKSLPKKTSAKKSANKNKT
ncbi:hypothetical protein M3Y98_00074800 [Aphelenchoides besseyi]|nr:hypothetical protein M3Y98_00074800 [Aphelenchoides besseyi]KAI6198721.1 hypothetical protein M3Y96_00549500 [Aphelenchoides besseyi]